MSPCKVELIPSCHVAMATCTSCLYISNMAVKQHVPPNRGAFIWWNIAPVPIAEWRALAGRLSLRHICPSVMSLNIRNPEESQVCHNLCSHWQISVFRPGEAHFWALRRAHYIATQMRTHTFGPAVLVGSSACRHLCMVRWPQRLVGLS